ncbi:inosine/uridine-preferring nucleoside hydrolase [Alteribacter lacisalsi]|uniref:Inosine/uridine-preferring nucleoside hydrolase n=1 Tax=Alteribacter lacisalsi TaxID=2045244 RepID=A0A2W0H9R5_9BACI|nr:nucleoside hydrolase [Alteribacter lacisalsi]PYZ96810.1 inosine/uridine-preferring nucleoside hydrolase [Alteribacter lacisalsi]
MSRNTPSNDGRSPSEKKHVLLFCDPGIDDAVAIYYAHYHPDIELVGIVAEYGNTTTENAYRNTLYLQEVLGMHIPVYRGAKGPMTGREAKPHHDIHGPYGLGTINTKENVDVEVPENFFDIIDLIRAYSGRLTIVTTGRLTSLATLCLYYHDLMCEKVKEIVCMAGAFFVPGNVTPLAEANVFEDPVAAKLVIDHAPMLTIIPLNVTDQLLVPMSMIRELEEEYGYEFLTALIQYYYDFYEAATIDQLLGTPLHDVVAFSALMNPEFFTFVTYRVYVEAQGTETAGVTFPDVRVLEDLPEAPTHLVAIQANEAAFLADFKRVMEGKR